MGIKRRKFQGVLNILSFNRHFYVIGLSILALIIISWILFEWSDFLFWLIVIAFSYGLLMPLIVSAYVYDFSGYYDFNWLKKFNISDLNTSEIININAGFDETSFIIKESFPKSNLRVFDFYNAQKHTEPAIVRARNVSLVYPNTQQINTNKIPLEDKSIDVIFLLSAAHEIRSNREKVVFLKECRRICKPDGKVIMVEHLRDFSNFMAFSVGFTHFFSRSVWRNAFKTSGFSSFEETKFTLFMSIFNSKP
ncbi:class I SAM-dependent methyltransferase [Urechidicola croceus]|uniref:Methyltransferase type 11 n=1 Tax=Urechidicola croceus TaxID=1850246 RepID=A0A1D8P7K9_9FLAO|nr:methyltransferase domain-containing protein [Urechidicola croceus]AOW20541.1 methyltransferase type 11 [Urechidicola croceus]